MKKQLIQKEKEKEKEKAEEKAEIINGFTRTSSSTLTSQHDGRPQFNSHAYDHQ